MTLDELDEIEREARCSARSYTPPGDTMALARHFLPLVREVRSLRRHLSEAQGRVVALESTLKLVMQERDSAIAALKARR